MEMLEKEITYKKELVCILTTCTFIIVFKFFITTMILSKKSLYVGNRTREDYKVEFIPEKATQEKKDAEQRWWFIQLNDMENFPFALIVFWSSAFVITNSKSRLTLCILYPIYTLLRIIHTIMFSSKYLLPRFLSHLLSVIIFWIASFVGIVDSFINLTEDEVKL